ncbi:MAG: metallophosphoesterase [Armatimonadota bacterium]|nr:metallophosphoesterase [Armatimonadota bacterium]
MAIYALADTHLSIAVPKPMDIFGPAWRDHAETIRRNWDASVTDSDVIIVAGDISWAMRIEEALPDLLYIAERPGRKILIRGNHDYWWKREQTRKIQNIVHPSITLVQGQPVLLNSLGITGTRGWRMDDITSVENPKANARIFQRELNYLKSGLEGLPKDLDLKIVALHYPPFSTDLEPNEFLKTSQEHSVDILVYGHIHEGVGLALEGNIGGVECHLVAVDHIGFAPKLIVPNEL